MGEDPACVVARLEFAKAGTLLVADAARRVLFCDACPPQDVEVRRTLKVDAASGLIAADVLRPWLREQPAAGVLRAVVNEGAGPYLCRPVQMGADVVVEDLGELLGGAFAGMAAVCARSGEVLARFLSLVGVDACEHVGRAGDQPVDVTPVGFLPQLLPQLSLICQARCDRAMVAAQYLAHHPAVAWVSYPGLGDDPGNAEARRGMEHGFGWRVAFGVDGACKGFDEGLWDEPHAGIASRVERLGCGAFVLHAGLEEPLDVVGALERGIACPPEPAAPHNDTCTAQ
jgi:hypothetical protein